MNWKNDKALFFTVVLFGIIYALISLVNHYNFRTYALDLGAYTNALYDYSHFQWNDSTVFKEVGENLLSDHFDLYLIILSPFSLIFGTYTLLIAQIVFILLGGIGVYCFFDSKKLMRLPILATIYFYLFFGVFAALSFDYHSNVIAASLVPWLFYFLDKRAIIISSLFIFLILVSKENTSLWLAFVCLGLAIENRKDLLLRKYLILGSGFCIIYFVLIISLVMPAISNDGLYPHFQYSLLGRNYSEAFIHLIKYPIDSLKVLFVNHTENPLGDFVKVELHLLLLASGLLFLFFKPQYILMLLPIYFQKLFHDNYFIWGIGSQYTVEYAPIMTIGIFTVISDMRSAKYKKIVPIVVLVMALSSTLRTMDNTKLFTAKSQIRFYQAIHYIKDYDVDKVHTLLSRIPKDAILSAQSQFVPHLALRDKIYQLPIVKDAEYILYSMKERPYPLSEDAFNSVTAKLENSDEWEIEYQDKDLTILKRSSR